MTPLYAYPLLVAGIALGPALVTGSFYLVFVSMRELGQEAYFSETREYVGFGITVFFGLLLMAISLRAFIRFCRGGKSYNRITAFIVRLTLPLWLVGSGFGLWFGYGIGQKQAERIERIAKYAVSYTHLTLPTILLV